MFKLYSLWRYLSPCAQLSGMETLVLRVPLPPPLLLLALVEREMVVAGADILEVGAATLVGGEDTLVGAIPTTHNGHGDHIMVEATALQLPRPLQLLPEEVMESMVLCNLSLLA
uniref:(California timema) hypothetical protein n=1 Tax=Timema californicum TaxID=61474 RepID=A0A7R9JH27_TIMCA|nr:unnamed protein product [Timema californicum]